MTSFSHATIFVLIICISGIASAQDVTNKKDRKGRDLPAEKQGSARRYNKKMLEQLELSDEQKTDIGQIVRQSQAQLKKLRQDLTGQMPDPETVAARKQLVKQLRAEGKTKQEIKDAIRDQLAIEKKPRLDESARNELMKSLQELRGKTSEKIRAILTDQQSVAFEQLIQDRKDDRVKGNSRKRKGKDPGKDKSDSKKKDG